MNRGAIVSLVLTSIGLTAMVMAFVNSASPYVTVAQAKESKAKNLHLAGDIIPGTLRPKPMEGKVEFDVKDEKGATIHVVYLGPPPSNMGSATKVVAVGGVQNGEFVSEKLQLKCPSKYESTAGEKY